LKKIHQIPMQEINAEALKELEQFREEMLQLVALPLHFLRKPKADTAEAVKARMPE
jgi:hypothetical protein